MHAVSLDAKTEETLAFQTGESEALHKAFTAWTYVKKPQELRHKRCHLKKLLKKRWGDSFEENMEQIFIQLEDHEKESEEKPAS